MSDVLEFTGKVVHVSEEETFDSGFSKRFIVLEAEDGGYTNQYGFQVFKDKCSMLDGIKVGQEATVKYNLATVREYQGKWFSDMHKAWNVKVVEVPDGASERPAVDPDDDVPF